MTTLKISNIDEVNVNNCRNIKIKYYGTKKIKKLLSILQDHIINYTSRRAITNITISIDDFNLTKTFLM